MQCSAVGCKIIFNRDTIPKHFRFVTQVSCDILFNLHNFNEKYENMRISREINPITIPLNDLEGSRPKIEQYIFYAKQ